VGPRTVLDDVEKRKFLTLPGLGPRRLCRPARSLSLYRLSYHGSMFTYKLIFSEVSYMFVFFDSESSFVRSYVNHNKNDVRNANLISTNIF
jgi:hypothetical protein